MRRLKPTTAAIRKTLSWAGCIMAVTAAPWVYADYDKALEYFDKQEYSSAAIELKNQLQQDPEHAQARKLLGRVNLRMGDPASAEKEIRRAIALATGADKDELNNLLAEALLAQGKIDETIAAIVIEDYAENAAQERSAGLTILGRAYMAKNQIADAKESYERADAIKRTPEVLIGLAQVAFAERDVEQSLVLLDTALEIDPEHGQALLAKGQVLASQADLQAAIEVFSRLVNLIPGHLPALVARAEAYSNLNNQEMAEKDIMAVLRVAENQPQANFLLARIQLQRGEYEAARLSAEKVLRVIPEHRLTYFVLGAVHYGEKNYQQAEFYLDRFVQWQPQNASAVRLLGATYLALDDPQSAVELLDNFDKNHEHKDPQLLNVLGRALLETGESSRGTQVLSRALEIDPDAQGLRNQLALGELAQGNTQAAIGLLEQARQEMESNDLSTVMLVMSYIREQNFSQAESVINENINSDNKTQQALYNTLRGVNLEAQGKLDQAQQAYQQANEIDADYIPAKLSLAKLDFVAGRFDKAADYYHQVLKQNESHLQSMLALAEIARKRENQAEYERWLETAAERNKNALAPVAMLVDYYLAGNQSDKALNALSAFRANNPDNLPSFALLAKVNASQGQLDQARSNLQRVIDANAQDLVNRIGLAQIMEAQGDRGEANLLVEEVLSINPSYLPALIFKARVQIKAGESDAARSTIDTIAEYYADSHLAEQLSGELAQSNSDMKLALQHYSAAFERSKTRELVRQLYQIHVANGDLDKGVTVLKQYLSENPEDASAKIQLATAYQQMRKNTEAIELYTQALGDAQDNPMILNNLAWLYWLEGDSRSLDYARKSYQLTPERPEVADTLGWIMLHRGDKKQALKILQEAASNAPANPDIRYHLAKAMADNGNAAQAKKELERLLRDYNEFSERADAQKLFENL